MCRIFIFLLLVISAFTNSVSAKDGGLGLDVSRVIFNEDDSSVSFSAKNNSQNITALLKVWVEDYYSQNKQIPFFITPPLVRIDPKNNIQFRVNKLADVSKLPTDRESVYSINVLAIPPKKEASSIQIALNTRIKLFYRPNKINIRSNIDSIQEKIEFKGINDGVSVYNPTPYFVTMKDVKLNGLVTKDQAYMIKPFSELKLKGNKIDNVSFSIINDYGGVTNTRKVYIK